MRVLSEFGCVKNQSDLAKRARNKVAKFSKKTDKDILEEIDNFCNLYTKVIAFNDEYNIVEYDDFRAKFLWVYSGQKDKNGDLLFIQFVYIKEDWIGAFIGTVKEIIEEQSKRDKIMYNSEIPKIEQYIETLDIDSVEVSFKEEKENIPEEFLVKTEPIKYSDEFYKELYGRLLLNSGWGLEKNSLGGYIRCIITRINNNIKNGSSEKGYVFNSDKTMALVNSGLLDIFGKNIFFISKIGLKKLLSKNELYLIDSKVKLLSYGFKQNDMVNLERVKFYDKSKSELLFDASIDDFDLDSIVRIQHCIKERIDRYPEEYRDKSLETLYQDLVLAINYGVSLSKSDTSYVKPIYNMRSNTIQFVIPYHVGNNFQKDAELGLIVTNKNEYGLWQVMTILKREDCLCNIKLFNPFGKESF